MSGNTIDTAMAKRLVEASAICGAAIIGQPGGWGVVLKLGMSEKPLGTQRSDKPRIWRSLDRCVAYLKNELHLSRFDMLDASNHSEVACKSRTRSDTSERMRLAHEGAAHDKWFREQVQESLDDPRPGVANDEAKQRFAEKREALRRRIAQQP